MDLFADEIAACTALRGTPRSLLPWCSSLPPTAAARVRAAGRHAAAGRLLDRRNRRQQRLVPRQLERRLHRRPLDGHRSRLAGPLDDGLRARDPHRRPEHGHNANLLGHELGRHDGGDDEAAQGRRDASLDQRRGDDRPERRGLVPNSPVTLQWSGTDATSGIASCSPQLTYSSPDTAGTSKSGSCTDNAGNTSAAALTVHYDSTPPATLAHAEPGAEREGLARSAVTVAWSGSDTTSGVASCSAPSGYSGPDTAGSDAERRLHRQRRQQLERQLRRQVRHAPADDERRPDTEPERGRVVPHAVTIAATGGSRRALRRRLVRHRPPTAAPTRPGRARA